MAVKVLIAGGGISGLSLAYALREGGADVTLLESEDRTGGKVWSNKIEGYLCEGGVNAFLDNKPKTLELASALSLSPLRARETAKKRFILSGGELTRLPESPPAFFKSPLMTFKGKARITLEPFIRRYKGREDETLGQFARRRLGAEAFEKLIDPMASGIYAGDPEAMSLKSSFPRINELEKEHGSLIKAMIKITRQRKKAVGAGPGGTLTSFLDGLESMPNAIKSGLGGAVRVKSKVLSVEKAGGGYALNLSDGTRAEADAAVLAIPSHRAAPVLKELDKGISRLLDEIPYPPLSVVCTGFKEEKVKGAPIEAFGFLVPFREKKKLLGTLFDSSIFPNRAPEGYVLLRSMVGGARAPHLAEMEDNKLLDAVMGEYSGILGINAEPDFFRVFRHEKAIPQYNVGHKARLDKLGEMLSSHRGLYLTGNAYRGVSFNDCIANSFELAQRILKEVA